MDRRMPWDFSSIKSLFASPRVIQNSNAIKPIMIYLAILEDVLRAALVQEAE